MGVKNSYFPLFVSSDALRKEEDHVEGFSAEVIHVLYVGGTICSNGCRHRSLGLLASARKGWRSQSLSAQPLKLSCTR